MANGKFKWIEMRRPEPGSHLDYQMKQDAARHASGCGIIFAALVVVAATIALVRAVF